MSNINKCSVDLCCTLPDDIYENDGPTRHSDDPQRSYMVAKISTLWVNGTHITYFLMPESSLSNAYLEEQHKSVRGAFDEWMSLGIGLTFEEVSSMDDAMIRVGFEPGRSWSYLGTGSLNVDRDRKTTNFGWSLRTIHGMDTVLHEIGHVMGLSHGHLSPKAKMVWNEEAVYASYGAPPNNWSRDRVYRNLLKKITDPVVASEWDPDSIMHYDIKAGLLLEPEEYVNKDLTPAGGLSHLDKVTIREIYPDKFSLPTLYMGMVSFVDKKDFASFGFFFEDGLSGKIQIDIFGRLEIVLILYSVDDDGTQHFVKSLDRSGRKIFGKSVFKHTLIDGVKYKILCRSTNPDELEFLDTPDSGFYLQRG